MCVNSEGSRETVRMRRLTWAFDGRLCGTIISWAVSNHNMSKNEVEFKQFYIFLAITLDCTDKIWQILQ